MSTARAVTRVEEDDDDAATGCGTGGGGADIFETPRYCVDVDDEFF